MPARPPLTHFLCLPLVTTISKPQLLSSLRQFAISVTDLDEVDDSHILQKAIRPLGTLHLTLGVMSLQSKERVEAATVFLGQLDIHGLLAKAAGSAIADTKSHIANAGDGIYHANVVTNSSQTEGSAVPLIISLTGLQPMHKPSSTSILYACPQDSSQRLQHFCSALRTAFTEAGFLVPETRPLLLHATIINTIYARERSRRQINGGHGKHGKDRGIDATKALERFGETIWAEGVRLEKVAICEMGAKRVTGEEGSEEYREVGSVQLP